jgi:hypothetical protein
MKNASVRQPLSTEPLAFPLSSRAKPRDLQFDGAFVKTRNSTPKKNCHLDRSVAEWRDLRFSLFPYYSEAGFMETVCL